MTTEAEPTPAQSEVAEPTAVHEPCGGEEEEEVARQGKASETEQNPDRDRRGSAGDLCRRLRPFAVGRPRLAKGGGPLPALDLSQGGSDATIVQLRLEELKPVANRLTVNVLVYPGVSQYDPRLDVLGNDVAVRLYPTSDLGDLNYPKGRRPRNLPPPSRRMAIPVTGPSTSTRPSRLRPMHSSGRATTARRCPPGSR